MNRTDQRRLHPDDRALWRNVATATRQLAYHTCGVEYFKKLKVRPVRKRNLNEVAGYYLYWPAHEIQIALRKGWFTHEGVEYWDDRYSMHALLDTICHEVAHAMVGREERYQGHGPKFFRAFATAIFEMERLKLRVDIESSGAKLKP